MKRRMVCLLLAGMILTGTLSACEADEANEMTAVTLETAEAAETETTVSEATAMIETAADAERREPPGGVSAGAFVSDVTPESTDAPVTTNTETPTEVFEHISQTQPPVTESTPAETEAATEPALNLRNAAVGCIGSSVSTLYDLIGYPPNGSSYKDSSTGDGEDGELYYDGFTVATYRELGEETVVAVY